MTYHYYINDIEVFPKGEWSISYQRNEGQIFFRRIFEGELTFIGVDYDLITALDCEIATFDIYCGGTVFWQGQFQFPYLVKFDADSCTVVLTPEVVDEYSCIMDYYETEYTWLLTVGGLQPIIHVCGGAQLHTLPISYPLGVTGAASGNTGYLNDIIIDRMGCGLTLRSSFLWRDNYANGDAYVGSNNYITGATNRLEFIYLCRNVSMRASLSNAALSSVLDQKITFKMFEDLLREWFNAYWFIDENGDFRIEHIYYFDPAFPNSDYTVGKDLQTVMDRGGRSFAYRRNKYEYETGRMYDQERWGMQHYEGTEGTVAHDASFEGVPIFYGPAVDRKSDYVPGDFKEKEHVTDKFWSDVTWAWDIATNPPNTTPGAGTPETIREDGFCVIDVLTTSANIINCEVGVLSANIMNGHLSIANLQDHYHQYDRIFLEGDMNSGDVTTFQTAQKHKLQESIEFPLCCSDSFDPLDRVRTEIGDGEVKAAIQKEHSLEVELWHEFDC